MNWFKIFTPQNSLSFRTLGSIFRILTFQFVVPAVSISLFRLSFSLLTIVFMGTPLLAKKAQPERLSDYLLTSKQLQALKPAEQVHYIAFLYHFTAAIEMLENSPKTSDYAHNSSASRFNSYVYLSQFLTPKAQAVFDLQKVAYGSPKPPPVNMMEKTAWGEWEKFFKQTKERQQQDKEKAESAVAQKQIALPKDAPISLKEEKILAKKSHTYVAKPIRGASQSTITNEQIVMNSRNVGASCVFGMWISEFKRMPDSSIKCTRPQGSQCVQGNGQPGFRCNTFGFSIDSQQVKVPKETCLSLYSKKGLEDLTERCVNANQWLVNAVQAVDAPGYDAFIKELKEKLDAFEGVVTGSDQNNEDRKLTFQEYCNNQPKTDNIKLQKNECGALLGLINKLREHITLHEEKVPEEKSPEVQNQ